MRRTFGLNTLLIVMTTGFFSGVVLALQMARDLAQWGQTDRIGQAVSITLVRTICPALTGLIVACLYTSGIAHQKRSRLIATLAVLPLLTVIADFSGTAGGWMVNALLQPSRPYWGSAWASLEWNDLAQGLLKTFVVAVLISMIGCYYALKRGQTPFSFTRS